ncbi:hypothetical protein CL6EHI_148600 [Entamoeba histolytica]|nr:hypothetical protein CL6EHI_148600 [Entamoeba histolytica]
MSQENRLNNVFTFWRQHENVELFSEDKKLHSSLLKCKDTKEMKAWLWNDLLGMESIVDEEKMVLILKLLKDEWNKSLKQYGEVLESTPELLRRCSSTLVLTSNEPENISPISSFKKVSPDPFENEKEISIIERPQSKQLIPLGNSDGDIDLVEISQSKDFGDGYIEKSTNCIGTLSSIEEFEKEMKNEVQENENNEESKEINIQDEFKKEEVKESPKGYKKKVSIMTERKSLDSKEEVEIKVNSSQNKIQVPSLNIEMIGSISNSSNRTSMNGVPPGISTMECKGDQSSILTMESNATTNSPIRRDQVEIIGLKARISELEQIIDEMNKQHSTIIPFQPSSEKSTPRTLSPRQRGENKAKLESTKSGFFGLSFKKKNKRKLMRSESERNMLSPSELKTDGKKLLTPQLAPQHQNKRESSEQEMITFPTITNEEYRQEVIRLNKQIVQLQRRIKQKDIELQAIVNDQKHFYPLMTLREIDYFHDDVCNDFIEIILNCLENKPYEVQQKYLCRLNDCAEVKFLPPDKVKIDNKARVLRYSEPIVRSHSPRSSQSPALLPLIKEDPVQPQEELYRCLCDSFITRQEEYYYLFQIVSYLYFAPFRQEGLSIVSKLDRTFPEMMMIERTLLRNINKGFINALNEYVLKLKLYIPFILMKDKTLLVLSLEIEKVEFKRGLVERTFEFQKKYGNKGKIPPFGVCINRICQRIGEISRFMEDILRQVKSNDINYMKIAQTATIAFETENSLKDSIVEHLELHDVKTVESKFLTIAHRIHDGKRRIRYFGGLKFVTPGEISKEWKMCILFTDILIIARPFAFGKKTAKEREVVLRFENSPRGRDVSELSGYRFNEEMRIPLHSPIKVMNVIDTPSIHNAFMVETDGIIKHFACVSIRERDSWVEALLDLNEEPNNY